MRISDWSSDVCSSDLLGGFLANLSLKVRQGFLKLRVFQALLGKHGMLLGGRGSPCTPAGGRTGRAGAGRGRWGARRGLGSHQSCTFAEMSHLYSFLSPSLPSSFWAVYFRWTWAKLRVMFSVRRSSPPDPTVDRKSVV